MLVISGSGILIVQCRQSPGSFFSGAQCLSRIFLSGKQLSFSWSLCSLQLILSQHSWDCLGTKPSVVLLRSCRDGAPASTQTSPKLSKWLLHFEPNLHQWLTGETLTVQPGLVLKKYIFNCSQIPLGFVCCPGFHNVWFFLWKVICKPVPNINLRRYHSFWAPCYCFLASLAFTIMKMDEIATTTSVGLDPC